MDAEGLLLSKGAPAWKAKVCKERLDRVEYLLENHSEPSLTNYLRWIGIIAHTMFWRVIFKFTP